MKIQSVANRGIGQFCVMLRDDPVYRDRCAARVAAGRADHLVKFSLEEEVKPPGKLRTVARGGFYVVYPDHDADPDLKPDIKTPEDQKYWEAHLRSRERRLAAATNTIAAARSRFPVLDHVLQPGLPREQFVGRWRLGEVGKSLEIMILRIAAAMDVERKLPASFLIKMMGRFQGDPMARGRQTVSSRGNERGPASGPKAQKAKTESPALPSKPSTPRPGAVPQPTGDEERVFELGGQEFVMDPDIGDGPDP